MATVLAKAIAIFAISASLLACSRSTSVPEAAKSEANASSVLAISGDPAQALVVQRGLGANLEKMANQIAKSTHTYGVVAEQYGGTQAPQVVAKHIRALLPEYQDRWNENLAAAYSAQLSQDELRSLAALGNQSPFAQRLLAVRHDVSTDMRARSEPLLTELVTKALNNAVEDTP